VHLVDSYYMDNLVMSILNFC